MKKLSFIVIFSIFIAVFLGSISFAHPGNTDSNGGHHCWTNCSKWGLEYGEYHYHNGGNSNPSNSNSNSSSVTPAPKPSYTQADVDEGREIGQDLGYQEGYERKDKKSSSNHNNEGFRIGYKEGYEAGYAEGLKKIKEEDYEEGFSEGLTIGKKAARADESKEVESNETQSEEWNSGYKDSYDMAYEDEMKIVNIENEGYSLGYDLERFSVVSSIEDNKDLSDIFKQSYEKGFEKRTKEETKKHHELGFEVGYNLMETSSSEIDQRFTESYEEGYQKGYELIKNDTLEKGYALAFKDMVYEPPNDVTQLELLNWYEEGFISNDIAENIKLSAYDYGYSNKDYYIPGEFTVSDDSIALYDELFFEGQEVKAEEDRNRLIFITAGVSVLGVTGGGGYYLRKKRKESKEKDCKHKKID